MKAARIERIAAIASAVLAAIPTDAPSTTESEAARSDMEAALADPSAWVADLGDEAAEWALEQAVEATADYTINGWEDDAARAALEAFLDVEG